jgi:D-sedoheptulose 7-phosphate isomerase
MISPSPTQSLIEGYFSMLTGLLERIDSAEVERIVDALVQAWQNGNNVLLMGNGGSSSSVSHIVADLQKNIQLETGRPMKTICLSDCTPLLSAWANDSAWDNVFAPQIRCWAGPGDVVIGVSGSGNSMNVINGVEAANGLGATTFGLAGYSGGKLKNTAQHCIVVESDNMQRIEDVHMALLHAIFLAVMDRAVHERSAFSPVEA